MDSRPISYPLPSPNRVSSLQVREPNLQNKFNLAMHQAEQCLAADTGVLCASRTEQALASLLGRIHGNAIRVSDIRIGETVHLDIVDDPSGIVDIAISVSADKGWSIRVGLSDSILLDASLDAEGVTDSGTSIVSLHSLECALRKELLERGVTVEALRIEPRAKSSEQEVSHE